MRTLFCKKRWWRCFCLFHLGLEPTNRSNHFNGWGSKRQWSWPSLISLGKPSGEQRSVAGTITEGFPVLSGPLAIFHSLWVICQSKLFKMNGASPQPLSLSLPKRKKLCCVIIHTTQFHSASAFKFVTSTNHSARQNSFVSTGESTI